MLAALGAARLAGAAVLSAAGEANMLVSAGVSIAPIDRVEELASFFAFFFGLLGLGGRFSAR